MRQERFTNLKNPENEPFPLTRALEKLDAIIRERQIKPNQFTGILSSETIRAANQHQSLTNPEFEENRSFGALSEGLAVDLIQNHSLFTLPEKFEAEGYLTADIDDKQQGVDGIVTLINTASPEDSTPPIPLGFDVTTNPNQVAEKMYKRTKLRTGIPYSFAHLQFDPTLLKEPSRSRKQSYPFPLLTIGLSSVHLVSVLSDWINGKDLSKHPVQRILLEEMRVQLEAYQSLIPKDNAHAPISRSFRQAAAVVKFALNSKRDIPLGKFAGDHVFKNILDESNEILHLRDYRSAQSA